VLDAVVDRPDSGRHRDDRVVTDVRPMGAPVSGRPTSSLDQALRYAPVLRFLRSHRTSHILEVGSGSSGLAAWWQGPVVGVDLRFDGESLPNLVTVEASATALPFPDRSFDAVVCTDVLEHLSADVRADAFAEMLRVSSGVVWVAFPSGPDALRADRAVGELCRILRREPPGWLEDHREFGLPERSDARAWPSPGFVRADRLYLAWWVHFLSVVAGALPGAGAIGRIGHCDRVCRYLGALPGSGYRFEMWLERTAPGTVA
jgi:SAM-dependent methyltransferase